MRGIIGWRQHTGQTIGYILTIVLISFTSPLVALAEDTSATPTDPALVQTTPEASTTDTTTVETPATASPDPAPAPPANTPGPTGDPGPQQPNGTDANKYTYNETTGLWESDQYTWDPVTKQTSPKVAPEYSYNPTTGHWDTTHYAYDPATGSYVPQIVSVDSPPAGADIVDNSSDTVQPTSTQAQALNQAANSSNNSNPTNSSNQSINSDSQNHGLFDLFYNAVISNNLESTAHTGDAIATMNTLAGNAVSGSASTIANVINLLQSSWDTTSSAFTTFVSNLFGDVVGDLFLDPSQAANVVSNTTNGTTINASSSSAINNTINLDASSGNAAVTQNTTGGDATSGDATAIANLVNAINSSINAHQSFLGVLNIFGNLNGDILMPPELLQSLMAANTVGNLNTSQITNTNVLANFDNNSTITNNIDAATTSGNATVDNNTSAGNATTGDASTNLTVLNLTGRQIIGKDAMLVFVNVLGKWIGMIVNAPTGSTSAALGGSITQNTDDDLTINADNNQSITNNITAHATTGDATVSDNTHAGNATSGDANTAVNLLNISDSQFSLSDWFGVLFINVFGTWNGSFGVDTAAGTIANPVAQTQTAPAVINDAPISEIRAFRFVPSGDGTYAVENADTSTAKAALANAHILSSSTNAPKQTQHDQDTAKATQNNWLFSVIGVTIAASLLGTERVISRRNEKNQ